MGNGVFEFSHKKALSEVKLCVIYNQKVIVDMVQWLSGHGADFLLHDYGRPQVQLSVASFFKSCYSPFPIP